ncbi:hypothetical protein BH23CHL2_BH23CHL2_27460 [soil metagenome]
MDKSFWDFPNRPMLRWLRDGRAWMRLLITAPNDMLASLLVKVLSEEEDIEVVDAVRTPQEAYAYADQVDIVAIHADVAQTDLYDAIRDLREHLPGTKIVLIHAPELQDLVLGAIEVGAVGYVRRYDTVAHLLTTLRAVHKHGASIDPDLTSLLVERMAQLSQQVREQTDFQLNSDARLTDRQLEVLDLVHQGMTNEEIGERLYISVGTVKNHVHNILKALEAKNREQAAYWYAWRHGELSTTLKTDVVGSSSAPPVILEVTNSTPIRETVAERLASFCAQLNWSIGHVFMHDQMTNQLVPTGIWYLDDLEGYREFQEATFAYRSSPSGDDASPNILFSPEPVWVADVRSYPGYERAQAARNVGIQSGLILPLVNDELIGIMEFYSTENSQPDPEIVASIMRSSQDLGQQIGERVGQPKPQQND